MRRGPVLAALGPWPREATRTELMDRPGTSHQELARCLADLARLNRLGPIHTLLHAVTPFFDRFAREGRPGPLRVLDVGTGNADVPVALARWARRRGQSVSILGVDRQPEVIACAAATTAACREVHLTAGEALAPPVRRDGVDLAMCSLMLHHLPEPGVIRLLQELAATARLGFVVSDLRRSRSAYLAVWLLTRAISTNRLTRHDGPLSVHRAYTRPELVRLSAAAGLPSLRWHTAIAFRVVGVYERDGSGR